MKLTEALKNIKKSVGAETLKDSPLAEVKDFLDTGSYAINRVLTGDIHKGVGVGRITTFFGLSQSGKSLIAAQTAIKALKDNKVDVIYLIDSEGGSLINTYRSAGIDMDRIVYVPVSSVEECAVQMIKIYDQLVKIHEDFLKDPDNNEDLRALCILDSYGALKSEKLINDAVKKDQMVQDMGLTAKLKNNMINVLMMKVVKSNATLIVINHEYQDPAAMFASKIHNMSGGKGIEFASHTILQCEKLMVKSTDTELLTGFEKDGDEVGFYKGNKMKFFSTKNRICKPCFQASVFVDFTNGISKYDGLIEDAVKFGFIEPVRGGYIIKSYSDKRIPYKELVCNDEIWNTFIEDFNKKSIEVMSYSNSMDKELADISNTMKKEEEV